MKKLIIFSMAVLALVACNKTEQPVQQVEGPAVQFRANIPNSFVLKSTPLDGKQVRIVADATLDNVTTVATANGNVLEPETTLHWKVNQTETTTFAALYHEVDPAEAPAAPSNMSMSYDMLSGNNYDYDYHSTFLTATAKNVAPEATVAFNFKHPFVKLTADIENNLSDAAEVTAVSIQDVIMDGTIDFAADAITLGTEKKNVSAVKEGSDWNAIIMPQTACLRIKVTVTKDETPRSYYFALNSAVAFEANLAYTASIVLDDTVPVGEEVGFNFSFTDWQIQEEAIDTQDLTDKWVVIGTNSSLFQVMTEVSEGVWEATIAYTGAETFYLRCNEATAKMQSTWMYYGLGELTDETQLVGEDGKDIIIGAGIEDNAVVPVAAGDYKLSFKPTGYKLTITAVE